MSEHEMSARATEALVNFIDQTKFEDLSPEVLRKTKYCLLDALGAAMAAPKFMEPVRIIHDLVKNMGTGRIKLWGDWSRVHTIDGALANALGAMALDLGDVHRRAFFHASAGILPAVWAAAEHKGDVSGRKWLLGAALGLETGIRIALAVNPELRLRGLDTTSQCGVFGAAAGSIKIFDGDLQQIQNALGLAGTQASGELQYLLEGDWSKCLHPGRAAADGVLASMLASQGYLGPKGILEGKYSFPQSTAGVFHADALISDLHDKWVLTELGMKIHAACRFSNTAIDAMLEILSENDLIPADISSVLVRMGKLGVQQLQNKNVQNFYDGQMSVPYLIAVAVMRGRVNYQDVFDGLKDQAVSDLMHKVEMKVDPEIEETGRTAVVIAKLNSGRTVQCRKDIPRGEPEVPLSEEELCNKFLDLASSSYPAEKAKTIMERILNLEELKSIERLWP